MGRARQGWGGSWAGSGYRGTLLMLVFSVVLPSLLVVWSALRVSRTEELAYRQLISEARDREVSLIASGMRREAMTSLERMRRWALDGGRREGYFALLKEGICDAVIAEGGTDTGTKEFSERTVLISGMIRYAAHTFGPAAASKQVMDYWESGALKDLMLEGGRCFEPAMLLLALEYAREAELQDARIDDALLAWVAGEHGEIPSGQRFFLLSQMAEMGVDSGMVGLLLRAEKVRRSWALELPGKMVPPPDGYSSYGNWVISPADESGTIAISSFDSFSERLLASLGEGFLPKEGVIELLRPGEAYSGEAREVTLEDIGHPLRGWRVALVSLVEESPVFPQNPRIVQYVWIAGLGVCLSVILVMLVMAMLRRQIHKTAFRNDLVATVSHELKTPIASVRLLVDTLLESGDGVDHKRCGEYLRLIQNENRRLANLVERFLTFSSMERNRGRIDFSDVCVKDLFRESEESFRERFPDGDYELAVVIRPDVGLVKADGQSLLTALANLLENAYKYTGTDKKIRLEAYVSGRYLVLEVGDNGPGIPKREGRRVFRKFYQLDRSLTSHKGGVGLGLSIVQFVAKRHKGEVNLISAPDSGCRFQLLIPL